MARLSLTSLQRESLECKADQAFEALRIVLEHPKLPSAQEAVLFYHDLKEYLDTLLHDPHYLAWNRGTYRANLLDSYLLQYTLGSTIAAEVQHSLSRHQSSASMTKQPRRRGKAKLSLSKDWDDNLRFIIDDKNTDYLQIKAMVKGPAKAGYYEDLLILVMDVRTVYQSRVVR